MKTSMHYFTFTFDYSAILQTLRYHFKCFHFVYFILPFFVLSALRHDIFIHQAVDTILFIYFISCALKYNFSYIHVCVNIYIYIYIILYIIFFYYFSISMSPQGLQSHTAASYCDLEQNTKYQRCTDCNFLGRFRFPFFGSVTCRYRFLAIPILFLRTIIDSIYKQKSMQISMQKLFT